MLRLSTVMAAVCLVLFTIDLVQRREPLRRVYPLIGRFPILLKRLLRLQRLTESSAPFTRTAALQIRQRALTGSSESSFGTDNSAASLPPALTVSLFPAQDVEIEPVRVGDPSSPHSFLLPRVNFGALGFGPASGAAIAAVAEAARINDCLHNSGEDGLTRHHRNAGSRLVWQIGTGYAGCRDAAGCFSNAEFTRTLQANSNITAIEIKISQGAKPGSGGFLPRAKVSNKVARIMNVPPRTDVISPAQHSEFRNEVELLDFIQHLRDLSGGIPIGLKICIGSHTAVEQLVHAMHREGRHPDYIVVDGAEGGTGSAPYILQQHSGLPARTAVPILHQALQVHGLRDCVRIIATGAIWNGFQVLELIAMGADACYMVRSAMVAMGCVIARQCHTGKCPSGIATQSLLRARGISVTTQSHQLARFYQTVLYDMQALLRAAGLKQVAELDKQHLIQLPSEHSTGTTAELFHQ
ncbi:FMN-binding glutamate synthase family protein [Streptomyces sp. NPDC006285]|uniref:FMN-binding glutamate synthase family protein n=1 Tax=Streptomyces sp. NPDC006285 TaxID=3364742 RepID=UPI0036AA487D